MRPQQQRRLYRAPAGLERGQKSRRGECNSRAGLNKALPACHARLWDRRDRELRLPCLAVFPHAFDNFEHSGSHESSVPSARRPLCDVRSQSLPPTFQQCLSKPAAKSIDISHSRRHARAPAAPCTGTPAYYLLEPCICLRIRPPSYPRCICRSLSRSRHLAYGTIDWEGSNDFVALMQHWRTAIVTPPDHHIRRGTLHPDASVGEQSFRTRAAGAGSIHRQSRLTVILAQ